jgi:ABC-type branched-subunit amino acid transport system substrate-binding protein
MKFKSIFILFCFIGILAKGQTPKQATAVFVPPAEYNIGLFLSFKSERTYDDLNLLSQSKDAITAQRVRLDDEARISLNYYLGTLEALSAFNGKFKVNLKVYDTESNDSIVSALLKQDDVKKLDVIIGPVNVNNARLVADFCKQKQILNIQPFSPSKSLTSFNPYHVKLIPTIDAHVEAMAQSICDSFTGGNVIIYSPKNEMLSPLSAKLDSLLELHNKTAENKITVSLYNSTEQSVNGVKKPWADLLKQNMPNVFVVMSFDENFAQGTMRALMDKREKYGLVVYGMPTWLNGEVMRLDYLNEFSVRITDIFYVDKDRPETLEFINNFKSNYHNEPPENAFLGYDVTNMVLSSLQDYGKDFPEKIITQRFSGTGFKFDVVRSTKGTELNYYENRHVNIFKVEEYKLVKVW